VRHSSSGRSHSSRRAARWARIGAGAVIAGLAFGGLMGTGPRAQPGAAPGAASADASIAGAASAGASIAGAVGQPNRPAAPARLNGPWHPFAGPVDGQPVIESVSARSVIPPTSFGFRAVHQHLH